MDDSSDSGEPKTEAESRATEGVSAPLTENTEASESSPSAVDPADEALTWIAAHCRFVRTNLPRGELGVTFAEELIATLPDACRRRVPDLTGTAPELLAKAVEYGLLTELPSARVIRAVPRLLAELTPAIQPRGRRHWTLWIVHLLDPAMQAKIRRKTPATQLEVCAPLRADRPRTRADLAVAYREVTAALDKKRALARQLVEQLKEGVELQREIFGMLKASQQRVTELETARHRDAATIDTLQRELAKAREYAAAADVSRKRALAERERLLAGRGLAGIAERHTKELAHAAAERDGLRQQLTETERQLIWLQRCLTFFAEQLYLLGRPDIVKAGETIYNNAARAQEAPPTGGGDTDAQ